MWRMRNREVGKKGFFKLKTKVSRLYNWEKKDATFKTNEGRGGGNYHVLGFTYYK